MQINTKDDIGRKCSMITQTCLINLNKSLTAIYRAKISDNNWNTASARLYTILDRAIRVCAEVKSLLDAPLA